MIAQLVILISAALLLAAHHTQDNSDDSNNSDCSNNDCPKRAVTILSSQDCCGHVYGKLTFDREEDNVHISGYITGMPPGEYGLTIHESGDISQRCQRTGGHFNPEMKEHGSPNDENRHVGDLGNVEFDDDGVSFVDINDKVIALCGSHNIIGRAIVLHAMADDLGRGNDTQSKTTGNVGDSVACGVIGIS